MRLEDMKDGELPPITSSVIKSSCNIMLIKVPEEMRKSGETTYQLATLDRTKGGSNWPADKYLDKLIPSLQEARIWDANAEKGASDITNNYKQKHPPFRRPNRRRFHRHQRRKSRRRKETIDPWLSPWELPYPRNMHPTLAPSTVLSNTSGDNFYNTRLLDNAPVVNIETPLFTGSSMGIINDGSYSGFSTNGPMPNIHPYENGFTEPTNYSVNPVYPNFERKSRENPISSTPSENNYTNFGRREPPPNNCQDEFVDGPSKPRSDKRKYSRFCRNGHPNRNYENGYGDNIGNDFPPNNLYKNRNSNDSRSITDSYKDGYDRNTGLCPPQTFSDNRFQYFERNSLSNTDPYEDKQERNRIKNHTPYHGNYSHMGDNKASWNTNGAADFDYRESSRSNLDGNKRPWLSNKGRNSNRGRYKRGRRNIRTRGRH